MFRTRIKPAIKRKTVKAKPRSRFSAYARFPRLRPLAFILIFAAIGVYYLLSSSAATPVVVSSVPVGPSVPTGGWKVAYADGFGVPLGTGAGQDNTVYPSWYQCSNNPGFNSNEMEVFNCSQASTDGNGLELNCSYVGGSKPYSCGAVVTANTNNINPTPAGYHMFSFTPNQGQEWALQIVTKFPPNSGEADPGWWSIAHNGSWELDQFEGFGIQAGPGGTWCNATSGNGYIGTADPAFINHVANTGIGANSSLCRDFGWDPAAALHTYTTVMNTNGTLSEWIDGKPVSWSCVTACSIGGSAYSAGGSVIGPVPATANDSGGLLLSYALRNLNYTACGSGGACPWTSGTRTWTIRSIAVYENATANNANTANAGLIAPGTTLTSQPPPPPAPTVSLSASPAFITSGKSSVLNWSSTNATGCTASGGWNGAKSTSGSQSVSPSVSTSYSINCSGSGGSASASASVTVAGGPPPPASPSASLKASPQAIQSGSSSTLTWDSKNTSSCNVPWASSTATSGTKTVSPVSTTNYSLACSGSGGTASATITVTTSVSPIPLGGSGGGGTVGGTISLTTGAADAKKVTYKVDGKTVASPTIDTSKLADGSHTVEAIITEPNGQVVTEKKTIKVNNHHAFLTNLILKYDKAATISGGLAILVVVVTAFLFIRKRPLLFGLIEEAENIVHHPNSLTRDYDAAHSSGSSEPLAPSELHHNLPAPGTIIEADKKHSDP